MQNAKFVCISGQGNIFSFVVPHCQSFLKKNLLLPFVFVFFHSRVFFFTMIQLVVKLTFITGTSPKFSVTFYFLYATHANIKN